MEFDRYGLGVAEEDDSGAGDPAGTAVEAQSRSLLKVFCGEWFICEHAKALP